MAVENLEVEVKFLAPDLERVRRALEAAGANRVRDRVFEKNVRFDTDDDQLLQQQALLRLRQDTAVTLTFKGRPPPGIVSEVKVMEELEVTVDRFGMMAAILERIGLKPKQIYEKYRQIYHLDAVAITLDELPFGNFVELEGEEAAIKRAAVALRLDWEQRITANYLALMERVRRHYQLPFDDLTFANFQGVQVALSDVLA